MNDHESRRLAKWFPNVTDDGMTGTLPKASIEPAQAIFLGEPPVQVPFLFDGICIYVFFSSASHFSVDWIGGLVVKERAPI